MSRVPGFHRQFRFPWRSAQQIGDEVDEELRFHLDMRTEELANDGMPLAAARREALRQFGDLAATRRDLKTLGRRRETRSRWRRWLEELWQDLRYGWRNLLHNPGFTAVAVLVLALGIGVNAAVFSLINELLLRPRRIERPEELVGVYSQDTERPDTYRPFSYANYRDIREQNTVLANLLAHTFITVGVNEGDVTRRLIASHVSANYFSTFGVPLFQGRSFSAAEEEPGARIPVVIVSYPFWEKGGSDPGLLGKTLRINGQTFTIIGIAPQGFTGSTAMFSPDLWLPLGVFESTVTDLADGSDRELSDRENRALMLIGRLKPGLTAAAAETELQRLAERLAEAFPKANQNQTIVLHDLPRLAVSDSPISETIVAAPSILLMGMATVVLLIASLNLANMLLARGEARRTEIAIRRALGGGRGRLLRQLLTEGLMLALLGGAVGLILAVWTVRLLGSSLTALVPFGVFVLEPGVDARVLAATTGLCVIATLFFALGPAWKLTRPDLLPDLKQQSTGDGAAGSLGRRWSSRDLLVVAQLALSLALLTAGGLFIRGALQAARANPGFSLEDGLVAELDPSLIDYDKGRGRQVYSEVLARLRTLPGVEAASLSSLVPFGSVTSTRRVVKPGWDPDEESISAHYYVIADDYFRSLRVPVLHGRELSPSEAEFDSGPLVAIIDEPLAERLFGDEDPLGQQILVVETAAQVEPSAMVIVGIVPGLRHQIFDLEPVPHVYVPFGRRYTANMHLHVRLAPRGEAAASAMLQTVRQEIRSIDERLPVLTLKTLRQHRDSSLFLWLVRAGAKVFTLFGGLALLLAVVGIYGVKAYVVSRRTREIGIRMSLGASPGSVLWLVLREGLILTAIGLGLGLLLALGTGQLLSSLLYEVSATDPLVFLGAALVLAAAALLAAYVPARWATKVVPTTALRYE